MLILKQIRASSGRYPDTRTVPIIYSKRKSYSTETPDHKLTTWGVYNKVLLHIQNNRLWQDSTCAAYDRIFNLVIAKIFDGLAYHRLTLTDFEELWEKHHNLFDKYNVREETASIIFCCFITAAAAAGYSDTTLWGMGVMNDIAEDSYTSNRSLSEEQRGKLLKKKRLTAKSIPRKIVLDLYNRCIAMSHTNGACIAVLLMLMLGYRTTESTGLSFGDIHKIADDLYALELTHTTKHSSRELQFSVKTSNGYRLLPLTPKLYQVLEERRQQAIIWLTEQGDPHAEETVKKLPLACVGTKYDLRCMDKEVNGIFKVLCEKVKIDEALFEAALADLREDSALNREYEGSPVVYLMRHQAATELAMTNASRDAISALMGHAQDNPSRLTADYASADGQRKLLHILEQRPLYLDINGTTAASQLHLSPQKTRYILDGSTDIILHKGDQLKVHLQSVEDNHPFSVNLDGEFTSRFCETLTVPSSPEPQQSITTLDYLRTTSPLLHQDENPQSNKWIPVFASSDRPASIPSVVDLRREPVPIVTGQPVEDSFATCGSTTLIALLDNGQFITLPSDYPCKKRPLSGKRLLDSKIYKSKIARFLSFNHATAKLIMSCDGVIWYIPQAVTTKDFLQSHTWQDCRTALIEGGCIADCIEQADSLLCIAESGKLVRLPLDKIIAINPSGKQLINNLLDSRIVSLCCCSEHDDILIASTFGHALHLHVSDITRRKGLHSGLVSGMNLQSDDKVCRCIIYQPKRNLIVATCQGYLLRISTQSQIPIQSPGSKGVYLINLTADQLVDILYSDEAVLLLTDTSHAHCPNVSIITPVARRSSGVESIKLGRGKKVVGAVGMTLK